jgi:hypothetical protein
MEKGSREETKYAKKGGLFFFSFLYFSYFKGEGDKE